MAELLDLDAEVLHAYLSDVIGWVGGLAAGQPRRIADLGAGTGTGTFALLRHFRAADAVAVDVSAPMLDRLQAKARELGVADRIRTVQADLDAGWPDLGPATWSGRPTRCTTWPIPIGSWPRSSPRSGPAACWRWPRWTPSPASCPTTPASAAPGSRTAARPPAPRNTPARCRIWAPTGGLT